MSTACAVQTFTLTAIEALHPSEVAYLRKPSSSPSVTPWGDLNPATEFNQYEGDDQTVYLADDYSCAIVFRLHGEPTITLEDAAIEALYAKHVGVNCAYCEREIPAADATTTPEVDDDEEWSRLAPQHLDGCEWIMTRAHRVNVG